MLCLPADTTVVTLGPDRDGEILALERHAFGPWDDAELRFRRTVTTFRGAEYRGVLVAYMGLTARRLRNGGRYLALRRLVVHGQYRREKWGGSLVRAVCDASFSQGIGRVVALVPEPCLDAQLFLKAIGFVADAVVREQGETAYRMVWTKLAQLREEA
jgi:predicted N-acetyltransferase YhbS